MTFHYDYPRPMVTVDILVLRIDSANLSLLLIRRKHRPFAGEWALPGGFIGMEERLMEAASRELREETGLVGCALIPLLLADEPERDPRGRTITQVFGTILTDPSKFVKAGDDASANQWFPLNNLPVLAFDHQQLIQRSLSELRTLALFKLAILDFFSEKFSADELEKTCTALFNGPGISAVILEMALKMKMIRILRQDFYQKTTTNTMIQPLDFFLLSAWWLNQRNSG
jgi:8-oxo-dGTP diphosphatase